MQTKRHLVFALALLLAGSGMVRAAVVSIESFDSGLNGWTDRDAGEMAVSHDGGVGNPAGSMEGSFAVQGFPVPQTDAFVINSGGDFVGNYTSYGVGGLTAISFDLYAEDIAPSDLFIRLIDGSETFTYQFMSAGTMPLDTWTTYNINLAWAYGWVGSSESAFNTALTSVDQLEIQLTRSGTGSQFFFLDNVTTYDDPLGPPPDTSAVPEPAVGLLLLQGAMILRGIRSRIRAQAEGPPSDRRKRRLKRYNLTAAS
jgi:hypothetical protein